ncbi:MAG: transketolase family protein [Methanocellales archaeon]|nr:transketolase family protein [Methanocellales archaeon]MDD4897823.1 transketolase family protein [Methanocellales archaeon]MDD5446396.1 transketolase family protein [Methanocellales archaeon]
MELKSTKDAYGEALLKFGADNSIVVLDADLSVSTQTNKFAKQYPERFFNVGCAEQNLIGVAAGLAIAGKTSFASTYAIFSNRAWEQIRNTVAYDNLNVKIAVSHAGLTNGPDGASHQSLEDIALMRVIPNMRVIVPVDAVETEKVVKTEISNPGPAYIRLNRVKTPIIFDDSYDFVSGKAVLLHEGVDLAIISTGTMVYEALDASKKLKEENVNACVLNIHTIKPIDKDAIIKVAKETGAVITAEEHNIYGGLGGAVAEILAENYPVPVKMIGVKDTFGESGEYRELLEKYCLTSNHIVKSAKAMLEKMR